MQIFKGILAGLFVAFLGFTIGKLSSSKEIILIGIPIGFIIGYKFTNPIFKLAKRFGKFSLKIFPIIFKQIK